ncbi:MAG: hypothetical protein Q4Q58_05640 [Thermoplasmata archaeon]|nr:hypothetical protein [Thermoplasmata archaeon]
MKSTAPAKPLYHFKGKAGGEWHHGAELIVKLIEKQITLGDDELQKEFIDWLLTDDKNVFKNKETGEVRFALAAKRGNPAYASKKNGTLDELIEAMSSKEFDYAPPGYRDDLYRMTRVLFFTLTFSHERYTAEQAWGALRSTCPEGSDFEHGVLNKFGANISKIFGTNGKLTCKEADSSGYPAPHVLVILDRPVLVRRHTSQDGTVTWRLANDRILKRLGKDKASRSKSFKDVEAATLENPVWKHGMMDVQGIIKETGFGKFANSFTYLFKYLIKTISVSKYPELADIGTIKESKNKSLRTMVYTHFGNKCFRTRDIVFGKAFKERLGLLKESEPVKPPSVWERILTIPAWFADEIEPRIRSLEPKDQSRAFTR